MIETIKAAKTKVVELEKQTAIVNLVKAIGHEVKRPFSMMEGLLGMLAGNKTPEFVSKITQTYIPQVKFAIQSTTSMLEEINNFGKDVKLKQEVVAPEKLIGGALDEVCQVVPREDICFEYRFNHSKLLFVDQTRCQGLFANIILNALQIMPIDSKMWFSTENVEGGLIRCCIGNSGSSIEDSDIERIFDPFFTKGKQNGNGLGLAIAKKAVIDHKGGIQCESSVENKTVEFIFTLPCAKLSKPIQRVLPVNSKEVVQKIKSISSTSSVISDPKESELEAAVIALFSQVNRLIVIGFVEDEALYVSAFKELIGQSGALRKLIHIEEYQDANRAISGIRRLCPDLLICDVDLGPASINGFELVRQFRAEKHTFPVCMHSNRCLHEDYQKAVEVGAQSFLPKPMSKIHFLKFILNSFSLPSQRIIESNTSHV